MKKLHFNIQLASIFLLEKVKIFYLFLAFLVYGISYFPLLLCEEEIINSAEKIDQLKENKNLWWDIALLATISIFCLYLICKGMPPANGGDASNFSSADIEAGTEKSNPNSDWKIYQANMQQMRETLAAKSEALHAARTEVTKMESLQNQVAGLTTRCEFLEKQVKQNENFMQYLRKIDSSVYEKAMDQVLEDAFPGSTTNFKK